MFAVTTRKLVVTWVQLHPVSQRKRCLTFVHRSADVHPSGINTPSFYFWEENEYLRSLAQSSSL